MPATTQVKTNVRAAVKQITRYTHNQQVAARLLYAMREDNRHRSLQWCVDKTIQELLRDRR
jgi:hypothetical protein